MFILNYPFYCLWIKLMDIQFIGRLHLNWIIILTKCNRQWKWSWNRSGIACSIKHQPTRRLPNLRSFLQLRKRVRNEYQLPIWLIQFFQIFYMWYFSTIRNNIKLNFLVQPWTCNMFIIWKNKPHIKKKKR